MPSLETQHAQRAPMGKFQALGHQSANYAAPEKYPTGIIQCVKFAKQASLRQMKVFCALRADMGIIHHKEQLNVPCALRASTIQ